MLLIFRGTSILLRNKTENIIQIPNREKQIINLGSNPQSPFLTPPRNLLPGMQPDWVKTW